MKYDLSQIQEDIGYELDAIQLDILQKLEKFIEFPMSFECTLTGKAGSGKTSIINIISKILHENKKPYLLIAPTNKAKNVLTAKTGTTAITIHGLLSLQPNLNILELDMKDLQFEKKEELKLKRGAIWIIDECSMINDTIYNLIIDKAREHGCKIIFVGDQLQLGPVKQGFISKTFSIDLILKLEKIYRQNSGSGVSEVLETLRSHSLKTFKSINGSESSLLVYDNIKTMLLNNIDVFKNAVDLQDTGIIKFFSYTNNRVEAINQIIRKLIFNDSKPYHYGEILTGYDTLTYKGDPDKIIENSVDYIVYEVSDNNYSYSRVSHCSITGYTLGLINGISGYKFEIFIIDPKNNPIELSKLASQLEKLRLKAINSKIPSDWSKYYQLFNSFATPIDLIYQDRVIKRKTLDYGYCSTTHKGQSDEYSTVLIDMENILLCPRDEELRQLQYVALSRTKGDIHLYQKNNG